jgi:hypothetical protein
MNGKSENVSMEVYKSKGNQYYGYASDDKSRSSNVEYNEEKPNTIAIRFELAAPYTVLNDGKTRAVEMKQEEIPANYEHFCVPKLEQKAYLLAHAANWEDYNLLDGEAQFILRGNLYRGKRCSVYKMQKTRSTCRLG